MDASEELHLGDHARLQGDRIAMIMADGSGAISYRELDLRSRTLAGQLAAAGLRPGDHIALLLGNRAEFLIAARAAQRSGLYFTPVNWHLTLSEVAFIIADCGARILLSEPEHAELLEALGAAGVAIWMCDTSGPSGFAPAGEAPAELADYEPLDGASMVYSSGTSGQPKGIKKTLSGQAFGALNAGDHMLRGIYGWNSETVFLCPAPLYHAAPLNFSMSTHRVGATLVLMSRFDAGAMLDAITRHRVTAVWLVPTMMVRLLKLPPGQRIGRDVSSLTHAVHGAAPCPIAVKQAMMAWWGPILYEFYSASEGNGIVMIGPEEWLAHPGSVGRSADVRIVGEDGELVLQGEVGIIYFASAWSTFEYHNDPAKTAEARNAQGWTTLGDMGRLDEDGYLYLTDRKTHMIISGGVNIYPQEIENILISHSKVRDAAVIGAPDPEYGEQVKAVVELEWGAKAGPELEAELIAFCSDRLAHYKCPRSVDFVDALPRMPTGKLMKRRLRATYWGDQSKLI